MPIQFACPSCRTTFSVRDADAGKKAECPICRQRVQVPVPHRLKTALGEESPVLVPEARQQPIPTPGLPLVDDTGSPLGPVPYMPESTKPRRGNAGALAFLLVATAFLLAFGVWFFLQAARRARDLDTAVVVRADQRKAIAAINAAPRAEAARSAASERTAGLQKTASTLGKPGPVAPPGAVLTGEQAYRLLVRGSVLVDVPGARGTGFVVSVDKRLVVSNYHVLLKEDAADLVFPLFGADGEPITDAGRYRDAESVRGTVLARDHLRDLALIRVSKLPDDPVALTLATRPAAAGSTVWSAGGSGLAGNLLWRLTKGTVRGRSHRQTVVTFGLIDCMILETDSPINAGDSGGPAVNDRGELVGVTSHTVVGQRQVSGIIDVEEVRAFLSKHLAR